MPDATEPVTTLNAAVKSKSIMPAINYRALWYIPACVVAYFVDKLLTGPTP